MLPEIASGCGFDTLRTQPPALAMTLHSHIPSITFLCQNLPVLKSDLSAQHDLPHFASDLPPFERSPVAAGELASGFDLLFGGLVHFDPCFGLFGEVEDFLWVDNTFLDDIV